MPFRASKALLALPLAAILGPNAGAPEGGGGEFYLVVRECATTRAGLVADGELAMSRQALSQAAISRCTREGNRVICHDSLITSEGHLGDNPVHPPDQYTLDEYALPGGGVKILRLSNRENADHWITVNTGSGVVVTVRGVDWLDSVGSVVCRGVVTTSSQIEKDQAQGSPGRPKLD
jgi:hypothetical protein